MSEGYCYFLDYMKIAYFPSTNHLTVFPEKRNSSINNLSDNEACLMTGLSVHQLRKLFEHLRIPAQMSYQDRYLFTGEECFLHYLLFNCIGETK